MLHQLIRATVLVGLLGGSAFAADNRIDLLRPDAPALAAHGDFKIGVRTLNLSNPNQVDILKVEAGKDLPRYDRPLTVEVWYPAEVSDSASRSYDVFLRDGKTKVQITGQAMRDAAPQKTAGALPLVIISHGYPGNRFLLSHLAENLATKGYVVASIDHTDSMYRDKAAFGSTLVNRSLDQHFVLKEMDRFGSQADHFLSGLVDASRTAIVGYSMGGYGAVITSGGGVTQASTEYAWGAPEKTLEVMLAGSDSHNAMKDPRIKASVAIAPWGMNTGFWAADGLSGIKIPMMFIAGSADDVSGYENGTKAIYDNAVNSDRYLLTFAHANHNAGAPMPAPVESWEPVETLDFIPFDHYADAVWDSVRMNNITQHFVTAFLGKYLLGDAEAGSYLDLIEDSNSGVHAIEKDGTVKPEHNYWKGFQNRTAKGLTLMHAAPAAN